jgi:bifunctional non-homologous end joining protein LigD
MKPESPSVIKRIWAANFPEVKDSIAALDLQDVIIDGAIVALDEKGRSSFQLLQGFD